MRFPTAIAAVAAVVPIISAHDGPGIPKIAGLNMRDMKARNLMDNIRTRAAELTRNTIHEEHASLKPRQGGTNGRCGAGLGSCDAGYCCSASGCKFFPESHQLGRSKDVRQVVAYAGCHGLCYTRTLLLSPNVMVYTHLCREH